MIERNDLIRKIHETTSIPVVSVHALKLLRDPDASMNKIVQCFQYDPSMTANIIKIANSSLFSAVIQVKTLREAIVRIGFQKTLQLLIGISMESPLKNPVRGYDLQAGQLWRSAISGAVFAEVIIKELKLNLPELMFTCCMLRDIGKILLGSFIEINVAEIINESRATGVSFEAAERKILGFDHGEAGAILMESWNMPIEFVEVARWHHRPNEFKGDAGIAALIDVAHIADIFSVIAGDNDGNDGLNYRIDEQVAKSFGLNFGLADKIIYEHELKIMELTSAGII